MEGHGGALCLLKDGGDIIIIALALTHSLPFEHLIYIYHAEVLEFVELERFPMNEQMVFRSI